MSPGELCRPPLAGVHFDQFRPLELGWFFAFLKAGTPDGFERALHAISEDRIAVQRKTR